MLSWNLILPQFNQIIVVKIKHLKLKRNKTNKKNMITKSIMKY